MMTKKMIKLKLIKIKEIEVLVITLRPRDCQLLRKEMMQDLSPYFIQKEFKILFQD